MAEKDAGTAKAQKDSSPLAIPGENLQGQRGEQSREELAAAQMGPLVASPTGPVPVSAMANTPERAKEIRRKRQERLEAELNRPRAGQLLTEEQVESLSAAELRAVARQRGYEVPGRRISVSRFMALQEKDEFLDEPEAPRRKRRKAKK